MTVSMLCDVVKSDRVVGANWESHDVATTVAPSDERPPT